MTENRLKVAVLMGGTSREREVSLRTGAAVVAALERLGHSPVVIDPDRAVAARLIEAEPDVAFIALHGRGGEDGTMQGLLGILGIPHTGSGVLASAAAMDKAFAKKLLRAAGLPVPDGIVVGADEVAAGAWTAPPFAPPWIVKPSREGSSVGIVIVRERAGLAAALAEAAAHDREILVERFIEGREITVGILGNDDPFALPAIEIAPKSGVYDYASKYTKGATEYIIPPRMPEGEIARCQALALATHRVLGCRGLSRVDLLVNADGPVILEANTIPGMTETSLLPKAAAAYGLPFHEMIGKLIAWALEDRDHEVSAPSGAASSQAA